MTNNPGYYIVTLGCPKNEVDSESMSAVLKAGGFEEKDTPDEADVIIVNTCCFIEPAREEAVKTILEAAQLKEQTGAYLIVTGCMPQRYRDELSKALPEVDSWMGLENLEAILPVAKKTLRGEKIKKYYGSPPMVYSDLPRIYSTPSHFGYLKIAEGCSHNCYFCAIPGIRGTYRSLPIELVEKRAAELVRSGRGEIILIAQDTTLYGIDLYGKKMLAQLLRKLSAIKDLRWLRLMYAYPTSLDDETLKAISSNPQICKYLDIPLQHSHPAVLKKMGRPHRKHLLDETIHKIRQLVPGVRIRTSFIVGHPGETEKRFLHLVDFVKKHRFYHLGVFVYSPEEGTVSADYKTRPSKAEAKRRKDYLLSVQQQISLEKRRDMVGKTVKAVSEFLLKGDEGEPPVILDVQEEETPTSHDVPPDVNALGRTIYDAPEIDGALFIQGEPPPPGTFFRAKITDATPYDLVGKPA